MSHEEDALNYQVGLVQNRVFFHTGITTAVSFAVCWPAISTPSPAQPYFFSSQETDTPEERRGRLEKDLCCLKQRMAELESLLEKEPGEIITREKLRRVIEEINLNGL